MIFINRLKPWRYNASKIFCRFSNGNHRNTVKENEDFEFESVSLKEKWKCQSFTDEILLVTT